MKIAHLILVHKNPDQVKYLIDTLYHPDCDIYIHIDKKSDIKEYLSIISENDKLHYIKNRVPIYWAGFGTIEAITNGFTEIDKVKYRYINVISGQDFPIKSVNKFVQYLKDHDGREFITCESILDKWKEAAPRVNRYHLINFRFPGKYTVEKIINIILPKRKFPIDYEFVGRANWFTLTNDAVIYYLKFIKYHKNVVRYFKFCWGADEFIFSTILYNSPFRDYINPNLVFVDWTGCKNGHPRILQLHDFENVMNSGLFFARKFDNKIDSVILTKIRKVIENKI